MKKYRILYSFILLISFVFALVYKGNLSTVIFVSLLILPIVSFLMLLVVYFTVKINLNEKTEFFQKEENFKISIHVKNPTPFPVSPVKIVTEMPTVSVSSGVADLIFSVNPFSNQKLNLSYCLKFRGQYNFSLKEFYCYDLLRLFRLRKKPNLNKTILVLPRRIVLNGDTYQSISEESVSTVYCNDVNGSELNFIRKYNEGDPLRQVHWKLSAKNDDYMVRQMARNKTEGVVIFSDLGEYFSSPEENAASADIALETALALSNQAVGEGEEVTDCWYDCTSGKPDCICVSSSEEYSTFFSSCTRLKTYKDGTPFTDLVTSMLGHLPSNSIYYLITPVVSASLAHLASRISATSSGVFILITGYGDRSAALSLMENPLIRVGDLYGKNISEVVSAVQQTKRN